MGLALYWKPSGIGSQEALGELKSHYLGLPGKPRHGIGHSGTLDPFAEGLLCVGVGEGTKLLSPLLGLNKTYRAKILFGFTSDMLDRTGRWEAPPHSLEEPLAALNEESLQSWLKTQLGSFQQYPPQFSAVHVDGKRAYEWARAGVQKPLQSRLSHLLAAESLSLSRGKQESLSVVEWELRLTVSSGTYIRSLARDWGEALVGFPGLLTSLVRESIGSFSFDDAMRPFRWLSLDDCCDFFEIVTISALEAEEIQRFGRWTSRVTGSLPGLLVTSEGQTVAWTEASSGKLGRVFLKDPFEPDSTVDSPRSFV